MNYECFPRKQNKRIIVHSATHCKSEAANETCFPQSNQRNRACSACAPARPRVTCNASELLRSICQFPTIVGARKKVLCLSLHHLRHAAHTNIIEFRRGTLLFPRRYLELADVGAEILFRCLTRGDALGEC